MQHHFFTCDVLSAPQPQQQQQGAAPAATVIESYSVPFPLPPYAVQRGVAASVRAACSIGGGTVAVLESPTGTGKSQSLLNGVLSHVAESIAAAAPAKKRKSGDCSKDAKSAPQVPAAAETSADAAAGTRRERPQAPPDMRAADVAAMMKTASEQVEDDKDDATAATAEPDSAESLLSRVTAFISEQDKLAKQLRQQRQGAAAADDAAFLVDAAASSSSATLHNADALRKLSEFDSSSSSSSSSSDGAQSNEDEDDEEDESAFADLFERHALAASSAGMSKIIYTSRTHSQLAQIIDELQKGPFRFVSGGGGATAAPAQDTAADEAGVFPVRYVHVGSRQQLCINDQIRGRAARGGGDRLNELCKEATEVYRAAELERKREERAKKKRAAKPSASAAPKSSKTRTLRHQQARDEAVAEVLRQASAGDVEDLGRSNKEYDDAAASSPASSCSGCEFADQRRIRQLLRKMMEQPRSMAELRSLGRSLKACPFYATRYAVHFSHLLLMPYTYLVDERMREQMLSGGLRLDDSISSASVALASRRRKKQLEKQQRRRGGGGEEVTKQKGTGSSIPWQVLVSQSLSEHRRRQIDEERNNSIADAATAGAAASSVDVSDDTAAMLRSAILVVDEGHNLAEAAATACTASVRSDAIASAVRTVDAYTRHFDARLSVVTKQRLRELRSVLMAWLTFLHGHAAATAAASSDEETQQQQQQQQATVLGTYGLTSFTFETDTAHVNFFTLVDFLESSHAATRIGYFGERHFAVEQQRQLAELSQDVVPSQVIAASSCAAMKKDEQQRIVAAAQQEREQKRLQLAREFARFVSPVKALRDIHRIAELMAKSPDSGTVVAVLDETALAAAAATQQQPQRHDGAARASAPPLRTLQILGLSPAQAVEPLARQSRAMIVAGGTLQPFQLLQMELFPSYGNRGASNGGLCNTAAALTLFKQRRQQQETVVPRSPPTIIVEAFSHVVDPQRFILFPLSKGASSATQQTAATTALRFTRATLAQRPAMLQSVCATLLHLSRVVPRGLVVFLPSFALEEAFFDALQQSGLRPMIEQRKKIFREGDAIAVPASSSNNAGAATGGAKPKKPLAFQTLRGESLFAEYCKHIEHCKRVFVKDPTQGALLVSVMGGSLSEGINFCDDLGRCVVVVGMPYPNLGDAKLQLKLASLKAAADGSNNGNGGGGEDWSKRYYDALCMRSINQSIGRCIRHVNDYAVVVLMDERFNDVRIARQLPKWMQPRLLMNADVGRILKTTTDFFAGFASA